MEFKIVSIIIKINEREVTLPFEEARQLFFELENIFRPKPTIDISSSWPPHTAKTGPYTITYSYERGTSGVAPIGNTN